MKSNYNYIIEKMAMPSFDNINGVTRYTFDDVKDPKVKKELELIQQIKLDKDPFAEGQLIAMYRGQISNLVNASRLKNLIGYDAAYQTAVGAFKNSIQNFKLDSYKKNKPITYFTKNINFELDKMFKNENAQGTIRMSADLNQEKTTIANADSILIPQLGRTPTNQERLNFIKNDLGYGKNLTLDKINRIEHYNTKELSGSAIISKGNSQGAETLTFEDVANSTEDIGKIINANSKEQKVINLIRDFTKEKWARKFLMAYLGVGDEFKGKGYKGKRNQACNAVGITFYTAGKLLNDFTNFCKQKGEL